MKKLIEDLESRMAEYIENVKETENILEKEYWYGCHDEAKSFKEKIQMEYNSVTEIIYEHTT